MAAAYLTIAAEIRDRIATGRLRTGERVPSARQITREWGVAIATATRVLSTLQAEGLVRPVVGVGTVVASPPPSGAIGSQVVPDTPSRTDGGPRRPAGRRGVRETEPELSRDSIIRTAIAIADAEGLAAVTMRRLAAQLDVAAMSLYRHVPAKDELVLLMVDQVLGEAGLPDPPPPGWRERIEGLARLQWDMVKRHLWMGSIMSLTRPLLSPHGMAQTDLSMGVFRELGFSPTVALQIELALAGLFSGLGASLQAEVEAERETGLGQAEWVDEQEATFERLNVEHRFPNLAAVEDPPVLDEVFELGLALLLDGLAQRLP